MAEKSRDRWAAVAPIALLLLVVTLVWSTVYNRWHPQAWHTPLAYSGDAWSGLAYVKGTLAGEIPLILPKHPESLGAPFGANWNDYPSVEEGIAGWCALLALAFGTLLWQQGAILSAHLLSAATFYFVCRYLRYDRLLAVAGAVVFAFSHFALARNVYHLGLTLYWHIPLGLIVVWWCVGKAPLRIGSKKWLACIAVAVVHGVQNPYYTGLFLQFLVWAAFVLLLQRRHWWRILMPLGLCLVVFATFAAMNVDTFYNNYVEGPNSGGVQRAYVGLELYALKPLELLLPAAHRIAALQKWTNEHYFSQALFIGEGGSPYLGIVGILGLAALVWHVLASIARNTRVPPHFWYVIWILLYSVVGGANGILGTFGMVLYRATNRYSIALLALLLLFLVRELSRFTRAWRWPAIAALSFMMTAVGLWDQIPRIGSDAAIVEARQIFEADRQLAKRMDRKLPHRAMVFQLPVMDYPEVEPVVHLADYEHFRPYLHSRHLRFSYGSTKGRPRERWQHEAQSLGTPAMIDILERYGFSAILIARKGYKDRGEELIAALAAAGRGKKIAESPDFVCLALQPMPNPLLPPVFDDRWSGLEGGYHGWRWSTGNADIVLYSHEKEPRVVRVTFGLTTLKPRGVDISFGSQLVGTASLQPEQPATPFTLMLTLQPGKNVLTFRTDRPAERPGNGDPRKLAFSLANFAVR